MAAFSLLSVEQTRSWVTLVKSFEVHRKGLETSALFCVHNAGKEQFLFRVLAARGWAHRSLFAELQAQTASESAQSPNTFHTLRGMQSG